MPQIPPPDFDDSLEESDPNVSEMVESLTNLGPHLNAHLQIAAQIPKILSHNLGSDYKTLTQPHQIHQRLSSLAAQLEPGDTSKPLVSLYQHLSNKEAASQAASATSSSTSTGDATSTSTPNQQVTNSAESQATSTSESQDSSSSQDTEWDGEYTTNDLVAMIAGLIETENLTEYQENIDSQSQAENSLDQSMNSANKMEKGAEADFTGYMASTMLMLGLLSGGGAVALYQSRNTDVTASSQETEGVKTSAENNANASEKVIQSHDELIEQQIKYCRDYPGGQGGGARELPLLGKSNLTITSNPKESPTAGVNNDANNKESAPVAAPNSSGSETPVWPPENSIISSSNKNKALTYNPEHKTYEIHTKTKNNQNKEVIESKEIQPENLSDKDLQEFGLDNAPNSTGDPVSAQHRDYIQLRKKQADINSSISEARKTFGKSPTLPKQEGSEIDLNDEETLTKVNKSILAQSGHVNTMSEESVNEIATSIKKDPGEMFTEDELNRLKGNKIKLSESRSTLTKSYDEQRNAEFQAKMNIISSMLMFTQLGTTAGAAITASYGVEAAKDNAQSKIDDAKAQVDSQSAQNMASATQSTQGLIQELIQAATSASTSMLGAISNIRA